MNHLMRVCLRFVFAAGTLLSLIWAQDPKQLEGDWTMTVSDKQGGSYIFSIFVFHVNGSQLTGYSQAPKGSRRVVLREGEIHGTEFSFMIDDNKFTGKMLSDTSIELVFPGHEAHRTYVIPKTPGASKSLPELPTALDGVDQTSMGPYRALAGLAYDAIKKGDVDKAATFARLLGRVWDRGETPLHNKSADIWLQIDSAMDAYLAQVQAYKKKKADPAQLEATYKTYLEKLKLADY